MKLHNPSEIETVTTAWQGFLNTHSWQSLIEGREPQFKLGPILYVIPNPIERPNESFSIADMRGLRMEQVSPHYHTNGEIEIHFVVEGDGLTVLGGKEIQLAEGMVVVIPPDTAHFTIPGKAGLVLAVVNTPPFNPANNKGLADLKESNSATAFDYEQFKRLTAKD